MTSLYRRLEVTAMGTSGYTDCACRDCFDVAVSDDMDEPDLCGDCEEAGCDCEGEDECCRDDAYGEEEEPSSEAVAIVA